MSTTLRIAVAAGAANLALAAVAGAQAFNCGDVIGPKEKVTFTADIGTCTSATNPALNVIGPATVDMAGFGIVCDPNDPSNVGIIISGKGVKIRTGSVNGCRSGVLLSGDGKHKIEDFTVEGSTNSDGIRAILSDKNSLKRVSSNDNAGHGVDLASSAGNKLEDVVVINNGEDGIRSDTDKNQFKRITAIRNEGSGLNVDQGTKNKVKDGVFVVNGAHGVRLNLTDNKLEKSAAVRNGEGGVQALSNNNQVKKVRVYDSETNGIHVDGSNNKVTGSTSLGSGDDDMFDIDPGCGLNKWSKNVFGTSIAGGAANPPCIQ